MERCEEMGTSISKSRIVACSAQELQDGDRQLLEVDGVDIALLNVAGSYYAFRNKCPHQGVSMIYGAVCGTQLPSNPQEYIYGRHNELIACPLHGWEFDMKTGKSLFAPDQVSIKAYEIAEEAGEIVLYLDREPKEVCRREFVCFSR
ncbi:Rieske (2Fe-2S) protein [Brevibacillus nitrificans]|uniref:Rieske (2Fe-2S) protein n=2 Tax=Brevibacillus nitrificans TaxID=651560 RepID=A0A3M8CTB5_9BACL|nr:Rieske (2Fe-2S) protein [Brevibacillus nitrificans]